MVLSYIVFQEKACIMQICKLGWKMWIHNSYCNMIYVHLYMNYCIYMHLYTIKGSKTLAVYIFQNRTSYPEIILKLKWEIDVNQGTEPVPRLIDRVLVQYIVFIMKNSVFIFSATVTLLLCLYNSTILLASFQRR